MFFAIIFLFHYFLYVGDLIFYSKNKPSYYYYLRKSKQ